MSDVTEKTPEVADTPPPLDFTKVEALRKHMLLNTGQMAKVLGVSRVTYSGWTKGKPIRKGNNEKARAALKKMFLVIEQHSWPAPEVIAMGPDQRFNKLLELMGPDE